MAQYDDGRVESTDQGLASTRPPGRFHLVRAWVLDSSKELSALRKGLVGELAVRTGQPPEELGQVADGMVLIATELATNAIKYGLPPTVVRLFHADHAYLLDVSDQDVTTVPYVAGPREPGLGGFGLQIARKIALDVGWYTDGGSKHVWAMLPNPSAVT